MASSTNEAKVKFTAEVSEFNAALKQSRSAMTELRAQSKLVDASMKAQGQTTELLESKQSVLAQQLAETKKQQEALRGKLQQAAKYFGENSTEASKLRTQLTNAETAEQRLAAQMGKAGKAADGFSDSLDDVSESAMDGKNSIGELVKGNLFADVFKEAASYIGELSDETIDLRQNMNMLSTTYQNSGKSVEQAESVYAGFYSLLGDSDQATEAAQDMNNLSDAGADIDTWYGIAAGSMAAFGDALPVENLIESSNETIRTSQVTGGLADALNWTSVNAEAVSAALGGNASAGMQAFSSALAEGKSTEDAMNDALAACSTEQERQQLLTAVLSTQYSDLGSQFQETNADVIAQRDAQNQLQQSQADLAASLAPLQTTLTTLAAQGFSALNTAVQQATQRWNSLDSGTQGVLTTLGGMAGAAAIGAAGIVKISSAASGAVGAVKGIASGLAGIAGKAAGAATGMSSVAGPTRAAGAAAGGSATQILAAAAAVVALGAGVLLASAGMYLLAQAAVTIASGGAGAAVAMLAMVGAIAALAAGAAVIGPALTAGAVGMVAFGAAVLMVGAGIAVASAGMALLAQSTPILATSGAGAAMALAQIAAAAVMLGPSATIAAVGLAALAAPAALAAAAIGAMGWAMGDVPSKMSEFGWGAQTGATGAQQMQSALPGLGDLLGSTSSGATSAAEAFTALSGPLTVAATGLSAMAGAASSGMSKISGMSSGLSAVTAQANRAAVAMKQMGTAPNAAVSGFNRLRSTVNSTMNSVLSKIRSTMSSARQEFGKQLKVNVSHSLALPHFSMTGEFDAKTKKVPKVNVSWYAQGGLFGSNMPQLIGVGDNERYSEAVLPLSPEVLSGIGSGIAAEMALAGGGNSTYNIYLDYDAGADANQMVRDIASALQRLP